MLSTGIENKALVDIIGTQVFFRDQTENIVSRSHISNQNLAKCIKKFYSTCKRICEISKEHLQIQGKTAISLFKFDE